jgi:CRISPR-associated endoribonuclease Cas6
MPKILDIRLRGPKPIDRFAHSKGLRALVLGWIARESPDAAVTLHEAGKPKPYSISPLGPCENGDFRFRIGVLTDWASALIIQGATKSPEVIRLGHDSYNRLGEIIVTSDVTWRELLEAPVSPPWKFDIVTPAAFHSEGTVRHAIVLPEPALYFGSLLGRWQNCCPQPFSGIDWQDAKTNLFVSAFDGKSECRVLDDKRKFVGFIGSVTFDMDRASFVSKHKYLGALALLAPYCGVGVETMRGFGQVRLVDVSQQREKATWQKQSFAPAASR